MPQRRPNQQPRRNGQFNARNQGLALTAPVEIRAQEAGQGGQSAGPRTFSMVAYTGEAMRLCWWDDPVVIDLATLDLTAQRIPVLYDHTSHVDFVLGQTDRVSVEAGRIVASGALTIPEPVEGEFPSPAAQVIRLASAGFVWQASVGGHAVNREFVADGAKTVVNGREYTGPLYVARNVRLQEISFVVNGADQFTQAMVARRIKGNAMPTFEEYVQSLGFDPESLTDQQRAALTLAYREKYPSEEAQASKDDTEEETTPPAADQAAAQQAAAPAAAAAGARPGNVRARRDHIQEMREREAAELSRLSSIRRICASRPDLETEIVERGQRRQVNLQEHAIRAGWTTERTELEFMRAERPQHGQFGIISRDRDRDMTLQALQGAMILRAGGRLDHPSYRNSMAAVALRLPGWLRAGINDSERNRHMEAAHRYADMSAVDLCREALRLDCREAPHGREDTIRAAFSGSALTNIFTTNVNAILLATYEEAGDTTGGWTSETEVADFKTNERPRMSKGPNLVKLPRGGEADHYTRSDLVESYKIARYAKQFVIDEQDMIDDSLGAFSDMPVEIGNAARRLRPDLVYAILLRNSALGADSIALFHASHSNLNTTAGLSSTTLKAAIAALEKMQENSVNLNLRASHLIVPSDLKHLAAELINSSSILYGGDDEAVRGTLNTLNSEENLTLVSDARLSNGVIDPVDEVAQSGSTSTWYLASAMGRNIEVAYRRGTGRAPQVRSFVLTQGKWGMGWDINMDIGAKALDYRGMQKNTA